MKLAFQIKAILAAVTVLFCLNVSLAQVPQIALTSRTVKLDKEKLEITYSLENKGQVAIYFADNPSQINGERGFYVSIGEANKSIKISSRVFPRLLYSSPWNKTGVELKKLGAGERSSGEISLKFPLTESIPPIEDSFLLGHFFLTRQIKPAFVSESILFESL